MGKILLYNVETKLRFVTSLDCLRKDCEMKSRLGFIEDSELMMVSADRLTMLPKRTKSIVHLIGCLSMSSLRGHSHRWNQRVIKTK